MQRSRSNIPQTVLTLAAGAIRIVAGAILLWSSIAKLKQPHDFLQTVYSYELVGPAIGMIVAMVLPWLELLLGMCLLLGVLSGGALLGGVLLSVIFTVAIASVLYRGLDISCGCFGAGQGHAISTATLLRSAMLLLALSFTYARFLLAPQRQTGRSAE